ncbi:NuA4 histone H4 acetyltransferase complex and the SWR1 complex subunit [Thoreauomyces humboldtii]|nr:NuA4 histone H4 acetyltransferase complex and the SWR1 complex subunit [Thoreauomyces humboldtii]
MSTKQRIKNVAHSRPIIYGTHASLLKLNEKRADPSHTHKWIVYVKGIHNEDLSFFIKKVQFKLHESFESPIRACEAPPYEVHETGWGEFDIPIKITLQDSLEKAAINFVHTLQLYPKEDAAGNGPGGPSSSASTAVGGPPKPVVSEHYDEIVFNEPTEEAHKKFLANPPPVLPKRVPATITHGFYPTTEAEELKRLKEATAKVVAQIEREKARLQAAEEEMNELKTMLEE